MLKSVEFILLMKRRSSKKYILKGQNDEISNLQNNCSEVSVEID